MIRTSNNGMEAEMAALINEFKNGTLGRTSPDSSYYFAPSSSSNRMYDVTINMTTGHGCNCKDAISKKNAHRRLGMRQRPGAYGHWCKHVQTVLKDQLLLADGVANRNAQIKGLNENAADTLPELVTA